MTTHQRNQLENRLLNILNELERQANVAASYPPNELSFADSMNQIREWIEIAGEYGLAYESLVATLESRPFVLTGKAAISLLEVGLSFGFKSTRAGDAEFNPTE